MLRACTNCSPRSSINMYALPCAAVTACCARICARIINVPRSGGTGLAKVAVHVLKHQHKAGAVCKVLAQRHHVLVALQRLRVMGMLCGGCVKGGG